MSKSIFAIHIPKRLYGWPQQYTYTPPTTHRCCYNKSLGYVPNGLDGGWKPLESHSEIRLLVIQQTSCTYCGTTKLCVRGSDEEMRLTYWLKQRSQNQFWTQNLEWLKYSFWVTVQFNKTQNIETVIPNRALLIICRGCDDEQLLNLKLLFNR